MRKLLSDKKIIFIVIIFIYMQIQILVTFAIKTLFLNYKIKELSTRLKDIAREIENGNSNIPENYYFTLKAFDVYGAELNVFNKKGYEDFGIIDDITTIFFLFGT